MLVLVLALPPPAHPPPQLQLPLVSLLLHPLQHLWRHHFLLRPLVPLLPILLLLLLLPLLLLLEMPR